MRTRRIIQLLWCAATLAGGARTSVAAQTPEPVSVQRAALDESIRSELQAVFDRVPSLDRVEVQVDAGVVRLDGTVLEAEPREKAAQLAAEIEGVVYVENRIREATSLEEQLQPTWTRLQSLGYGIIAKLPLVAVALVIVVAAGVLGGLLARWSGPAFLGTRNPFLQNLIRRALQTVLVLLGFVLALDLLDATALVGAVVGTAGLAGLALGFAFKDIVENYLAGTILALRQPFAQNDEIEVDAFHGKVVRLTPRETILMTLDGNHVRLPNALIFRSPMVNYTRNPLRQFLFTAGLGPTDDLAHARDVGVSALQRLSGVLRDPAPQALVMELANSSVTMQFSAWIDQRESEWMRVRSEAIRTVKLALESAGLTLPSPGYVVQLQRERAEAPTLRPSLAPAGADKPPADVSVDRTLEKQIDAERSISGEADLLDAPGGGATKGAVKPGGALPGPSRDP
jgi:small-conductance mechanosensitive channel